MKPREIGWIRAGFAALALVGLTVAATSSTAVVDFAGASPSEQQRTTPLSRPTTSSVHCVGPELSGLRDVPDQPQEVTVRAEAPPAEVSGITDPGSIDLAAPDGSRTTTAGRVAGVSTGQPGTVTGTGHDGSAPGLIAAQQYSSDTNDLRGLSLAGCGQPVADAWLVAGGGDAGRQERLLLANPGANEVTVDVTVLGAKGIVASENGRGIVVPGRGRTSVLLDAVAAGEASPTVHVTVRGGTVVPALADTWLDGSVPAGAETTTAAAAPAIRQLVPVADLAQAGVLRVAVPGDTEAVVNARLVSTSGAAPLPGGGVQRIAGGSSVDIPLADVPAGTYAVEINADLPVVTAVFSAARAASEPGDFAWTPASATLGPLFGLPLPELGAGTRQLALVSSGADATVTVTTRGQTVTAKDVSLPADTLVLVDLTGAQSVWVATGEGRDSGEGVHGAVLSTVGTGPTRLLAATPLLDVLLEASTTSASPLP